MLLGLLTVGIVLCSGRERGADGGRQRDTDGLLLLQLLRLVSPHATSSSSSEEAPEGMSRLARSTARWMR